jgi:tryptophan synthase beta chain
MSFQVSPKGFYGNFGGAFVPEMLWANVQELADHYLVFLNDPAFLEEYHQLLRDYVGRPTPLYRAARLSAKYGTQIFLKREDLCHTGAHKVNNTVGQILMAERLGKKRIIAETGAGQHGVATATVCALRGLECIVFMGEVDIKRQAPNVARMRMLGAEVRPASSGSMTLKDATNEAIRYWINHPNDTHYIIGSVVGPHPYPDLVARLQSVISAEMRVQLLEKTGWVEKLTSERSHVGRKPKAAAAYDLGGHHSGARTFSSVYLIGNQITSKRRLKKNLSKC